MSLSRSKLLVFHCDVLVLNTIVRMRALKNTEFHLQSRGLTSPPKSIFSKKIVSWLSSSHRSGCACCHWRLDRIFDDNGIVDINLREILSLMLLAIKADESTAELFFALRPDCSDDEEWKPQMNESYLMKWKWINSIDLGWFLSTRAYFQELRSTSVFFDKNFFHAWIAWDFFISFVHDARKKNEILKWR